MDGDAQKAKTYAQSSFDEVPTEDAGILLASSLNQINDSEGSLKVLSHPVFESAQPWIQRQQMELLFQLGETQRATELFHKLKASEFNFYWDETSALKFAEGGNIDLAREVLNDLETGQWNQERVFKARFDFELEYGSREKAVEAYQSFRDLGFKTDPLFRNKFALIKKYPSIGIGFQDLTGIALFIISLCAMLLVPLTILIPVHYWGLLRARKGKTGGLQDSPFGIIHAWLAFGIMLATDTLVVWIYNYQSLETWWKDVYTDELLGMNSLPQEQGLSWLLIGITLIFILTKTRSWALLGSRNWPIAKSIVLAIGLCLLLRMLVGFYALIFPQILGGGQASGSPFIDELSNQLIASFGPIGIVVGIGIIVPIIEEILFRGILLHAFARYIPFGWANIIQSVLFASIHEDYRLAPFYIVFGMITGELTRRSGGLLGATLFHMLNNILVTVAMTVAYYTNQIS